MVEQQDKQEFLAGMKITFLGTGTSHGVPTIDCIVGKLQKRAACVCTKSSNNILHRRSRCSLLVSHNNQTILIDVSLDFREQMLRHCVKDISAVLLTHAHADHIGGIPDIRSYTSDTSQPLNFFGSHETLSRVQSTFSYIFDPNTFVGGGIPHITLSEVNSTFSFNSIPITPIPVLHGSLTGCYGFRIGDMAYIPDLKSMPDSSLELCKGVSTLVINCMRITRPHVSHLILSESLELARLIGAKRTFFTHMSHEVDYEEHSALLDTGKSFAYDGLSVDI